MPSVFSRLVRRVRLRHAKVTPRPLTHYGISIEGVQPVFDAGRMQWWARWTYPLGIGTVISSTLAAELIWSHWTTWEPLPADTPATDAPARRPDASSASSETTPDTLGHYVLRPWYQRAPFVALDVFCCCGIIAVLIGVRSRMVRKMFVLPPAQKEGERLVVVQSPLHWRQYGDVYPLSKTKLGNSPDKTEVTMTAEGLRGHYSIGLTGAQVDGKQGSLWDAKKALFATWYGTARASSMMADGARVPRSH
ncbi:uncharacterized protein BXZ73DRAFT_98546 [Epithele typhae]|uniref:uncharacterized protein n=1 Tax=Epithele typhae TaxID=378194 RepID=UPI0020076C17|nr:uncharacterized protein BXZ73DRAFT_98546 [Epithele typhae]KAH9940718.1 hypothetical protein BXZ73DRAFT_98546 [Epithele typhae]